VQRVKPSKISFVPRFKVAILVEMLEISKLFALEVEFPACLALAKFGINGVDFEVCDC
jgi:hypothetical protein